MIEEIRSVRVGELRLYPTNPRQGDVGAISESLKANGQFSPIVVQRSTNQILSGNHTYMAACGLGWDRIDAVFIDVDDAAARRIVLAANRTSDLADYDHNQLAELLDVVHTESGPDGLVGTGFDLDDFEEVVALSAKGSRSPWDGRAKQGTFEAGKVKAGTVWQVGPHLIACGDSRDSELWAELLDGRRASLLFTDPPYGIDYDGGGGVEREKLAGDTPDEAPLLAAALDAIGPVMAEGAASYVCLPSGDILPAFAHVLADRGLWRLGLVWCKDKATFGRADYHQQHELIVYGWHKGPRHAVVDRTETSVWHVSRPADSDLHPTSKPVELPARAIRNSTRPGQIVVDTFAGSFSTVVAAHREGRVGVGVELEPGYVNAALAWIEDETGETRVRIR